MANEQNLLNGDEKHNKWSQGMRLIDKDDLMQKLGIAEECNSNCPRYGTVGCKEDSAFVYACECITEAEVLTIDMIGDKLNKKEVIE